jgi:single-strand DNA-binding protein
MNKVILIGRIGKLNDLKTAMKYSLATTKSVKNSQTGDWDEKTEWHQLVSFKKCSDYVRNNLQPGDHVQIEGELQTSKWQDSQGIDRYTTEIVVFDFPKKLPKYWSKEVSAAPQQAAAQPQYAPQSQTNGSPQPMSATPDWAGGINI